MAPVVGFDLGAGAFATTYAHDCHNLTVVATGADALVKITDRGLVRVAQRDWEPTTVTT